MNLEPPEHDAVPAADGHTLLMAFDKISSNEGNIDVGRCFPGIRRS
jgi:hypothetical protein